MSNFQEDLWLVQDPLAFCMSTNTFNNPAFEAILVGSPSASPSIRRVSNPSICEEEKDEKQVVGEVKSHKKPSEEDRELGKLKAIRKEFAEALNSFCDNIGFSLKSKLFVLELSLKRKLGRFRRFFRTHGRLDRVFVLDDNDRGVKKYSNGTNYPAEQWLYWLEGESNSKESLSQQKERILDRLEKVKRATKQRRLEELDEACSPVLFNMEYNGARWSSAAKLWSANVGSSSLELPGSVEKQVEPTSSGKVLRVEGSRAQRKRKPTRTSKWKHSRGSSKYNYQTSERRETNNVRARAGAGAGVGARAEAGIGTGTGKGMGEDSPIQQKLCIICYTNQPNIVTLPCKHDEICSDCFVELIYGAVKHSRFPLKCVLCRQKVERIRCSRRWLLSVIEKSRLLA